MQIRPFFSSHTYMRKKEEHHHITIIYDSITNAVFQSQVITPLLNNISKQPHQFHHLISFEKDIIEAPHYDHLTITLFKRYPYINSWSLWPAINQIKKYLQQLPSYSITARGPFAGYIALQAQDNRCKELIIQARGLAAQEYAYAHGRFSLIHYLRIKMLHHLEKSVYSTYQKHVSIEAVSPALKKYLIETFNADPQIITIAQHDLPQTLSCNERSIHRQTIRDFLHIPDNKTVYCYSGSYKPWQCPKETFELFLTKYTDNPHAYLLILTPDPAPFQTHAQEMQLPPHSYQIHSVCQEKLLHYLAAADYGILLRKPHIINKVSRPTKALEYHAAGLKIIHNGTIDYIS